MSVISDLGPEMADLPGRDGGPDAAFSLEPAEFTHLVRDCKDAWTALGRAHYDVLGSERGSLQFRRSLYVTSDVKAGAPLSRANIRSVRPGNGLPPAHLEEVLGRPLRDCWRAAI